MKLSIIIPVYNEEQTIAEVIERVWQVDLGDLEREVIIANDGSNDGTGVAIDASPWAHDARVRIYNSPINLGKGAAVRLGLAFATGDILLVQDADLELDPNEYGRLLAPMLEPALLAPWLVGVGRWSWLTLHGREIAAGAIALATWIAALHFPPRPRHIWIRHSAPA